MLDSITDSTSSGRSARTGVCSGPDESGPYSGLPGCRAGGETATVRPRDRRRHPAPDRRPRSPAHRHRRTGSRRLFRRRRHPPRPHPLRRRASHFARRTRREHRPVRPPARLRPLRRPGHRRRPGLQPRLQRPRRPLPPPTPTTPATPPTSPRPPTRPSATDTCEHSSARATEPDEDDPDETIGRPRHSSTPPVHHKQDRRRALTEFYSDCAAARSAGSAPLRSGETGYRPALDRDSDGVACEN
ncbi:excalibur calcium-binding domain-containing protein [Pseudonocardia sp.]|uniref:excalibur calcium-binding domain-containing protein n=1 Tax=Pseudonocardia sp. TaxID=60912 RepID=UPI0026195DBD|nr:excalibur calcium-binding domain-containing protein [Pseudonocardia sp.]